MERTRPDVISAGAPSTKNGRTPKPDFRLMLVTPDLAREWLEHNSHNRPVKWRSVRQYAGAMRRGEWLLNGDSIRFDRNGVLIDGQNRLYAIIEAEMPIETLVGTGLEPETQDTMDTGAKRTLADSLVLRGATDATKLAVVTRWGFLWERHLATQQPMDHRADPPTNQQLISFYDHRKSRLTTALREGNRINGKFRPISGSVAGVGWYIFHELQWEDCQDFFYKLGLGASLAEDNPIFVLRRWLQNNHEKPHDKARLEVVLAVVIKAWNAYRDGTHPEYFKWVGGGSSPERFPIAR